MHVVMPVHAEKALVLGGSTMLRILGRDDAAHIFDTAVMTFKPMVHAFMHQTYERCENVYVLAPWHQTDMLRKGQTS